MEKDVEKTTFYRSFMTCVFAGLIGTMLSMFFDLAFVQIVQFPLSSIVNVSTLIFGINILFGVIGFLYYWLIKYFSFGEPFYSVMIILITAFFIWKLQSFQRTDNAAINTQFRWLASGIIILLGTLASVVVPFLYHNKKFDEYVL